MVGEREINLKQFKQVQASLLKEYKGDNMMSNSNTKNKPSLFGTYNIPIDIWNPWMTSSEVILRIKQSVKSGFYKDAISLFEEAQRDMSLEDLNAVKSACAEELIAARRHVL